MTPLPLPFRVAAGLAATAIERARELPQKLVELPVTVASQAMQLSMRVQQEITALAIRGDEALASFRPVDETPEWATFDEDLETYDVSRPETNGAVVTDPWEMEESAIAEVEREVEEAEQTPPPAGVPNYDDLSLPQLRARLRTFSKEELEELLRYEQASAARASFIGMLTRRIASVSAASPPDPQTDSQ
ncbi:lipid droplet-associated protein [Kibdelosporangium philippinense]|uniref:Lipid droplet-associated protein n=1 Tax=Kibdelosporangium philippinense TaxID=211113 RepID=A0ABS8ZLX0_9PSEU|nr:lipid droplet-associated protein [Kibdelosporangium philippinense]MCE7008567.1 lipid droplet-associated protein [Kibdelosporangium philippinense]